MNLDLLVIAKEPVAGKAKTRLCPPCTAEQAARVAQAALADTLEAVASAPARRRVLVLDGAPGDWLPAGFEVVPQAGGDLACRLAGAFSWVDGPAFLIGMDTPQVTPDLIERACEPLLDGAGAVLGLAEDGGFWAIGLRDPDPEAFAGVPMSLRSTGQHQLDRLRELGVETVLIPTLRDVDRFEDAVAVASQAPGGRFAATVRSLVGRRGGPS